MLKVLCDLMNALGLNKGLANSEINDLQLGEIRRD